MRRPGLRENDENKTEHFAFRRCSGLADRTTLFQARCPGGKTPGQQRHDVGSQQPAVGGGPDRGFILDLGTTTAWTLPVLALLQASLGPDRALEHLFAGAFGHVPFGHHSQPDAAPDLNTARPEALCGRSLFGRKPGTIQGFETTDNCIHHRLEGGIGLQWRWEVRVVAEPAFGVARGLLARRQDEE